MVKHGESGFLVEANELSFAEKVEKALKNKELLSSLSKKAKVHAQQFSSERFSKKIEDIYKSFAAS